MIEIELDYNVKQFIIIHLNYHIFCCSSYTRNTYSIIIHIYVNKPFLRSILSNAILEG